MKSGYKLQFLYSILLILIIPIIMAANTVLSANNLHKLFDQELQQKSALLANSFGPVAVGYIERPAQLAQSMENLRLSEPDIRELTVYRYVDNSFVAVASTNTDKKLQTLNSITSSLAWREGKATSSVDIAGDNNERVWSVVTPLSDGSGNKVALLESKISTYGLDQQMNQIYNRGLAALVVETVIILLLLINHFQFANYARLFTAMKEATRIRTAFLNAVSQGLEVPAVSIKNYATIFQKAYSERIDPRGREYLDAMLAHSQKLLSIILNLLEYSKVEGGTVQLAHSPIMIVALGEEACTKVQSTITTSGVVLKHAAPGTNPVAMGDRDMLRQIEFAMLSVISHSAKYGEITLSYEAPAKHWVAIIISAPGLIVDPDSQSAFFKEELSSGVDASSNLAELGITYWVSSRMVERMGGHMQATFDEQGRSQFALILPAGKLVKSLAPKPDLNQKIVPDEVI